MQAHVTGGEEEEVWGVDVQHAGLMALITRGQGKRSWTKGWRGGGVRVPGQRGVRTKGGGGGGGKGCQADGARGNCTAHTLNDSQTWLQITNGKGQNCVLGPGAGGGGGLKGKGAGYSRTTHLQVH